MRLILATIFLLFSIMSTIAQATWTGKQNIHDIHVHGNDIGVSVRLTPFSVMVNPDGCASPEWYFLTKGHPVYEKYYQQILTSAASGRKISFRLVGCHIQNKRPLIEEVIFAGF